MVLDSGAVAVLAVCVVGLLQRASFVRLFKHIVELKALVATQLVPTKQLAATVAQPLTPRKTHEIISIEPDGSVNSRISGTDQDLPFELWRQIATGVPGHHWFLQDGQPIGYLEF